MFLRQKNLNKLVSQAKSVRLFKTFFSISIESLLLFCLNKHQKLFFEFSSKSFCVSFLNTNHYHDCLILEFNIFITVHQRFRRILTVNAAKKQFHQSPFEAVFKRVIQRVNEVDFWLQNANEDYAKKFKIKNNIHRQFFKTI